MFSPVVFLQLAAIEIQHLIKRMIVQLCIERIPFYFNINFHQIVHVLPTTKVGVQIMQNQGFK